MSKLIKYAFFEKKVILCKNICFMHLHKMSTPNHIRGLFLVFSRVYLSTRSCNM